MSKHERVPCSRSLRYAPCLSSLEELSLGVAALAEELLGSWILASAEAGESTPEYTSEIYLTTLFAEVEVNSGGYLPSHFGEVNISIH